MQTVISEKFQVINHYIRINHHQQWFKIKKKLNLPIWASFYKTSIKPEPLEEMEFIKEAERVRTNYTIFLKAIGDLKCELGTNYVTFSSVKVKFLELAKNEYNEFIKKIEKEPLTLSDKNEIKKKTEQTRDKHLEKAKLMMNKRRNIDSLNDWLKNRIPAIFIIEKEEKFKLLIY